MREILFRGKPLGDLHGKFIYGSLGVLNTDLCAIYHCFEFKDDEMELVYINTVGQYTGLTDKNGKKIFEGDIVAYCTNTNRATNKELHEVVFETRGESGYFGIKISNIETWGFCPEVPAKLMEVIGNIYDNPELLEV